MSIKRAESFATFLLIVKSDRTLRQIINKVVKERGDMTLTEWLVLSIIASSPKEGVRMSEIARELGVTLPQVTALLDSLLVKKLVRQRTHKDDRRNRFAVATPRGEDTVKKLNRAMDEQLAKVFHGVPATHLQIYKQVLGVVANRSKENQ